jgi:hypothetical protein
MKIFKNRFTLDFRLLCVHVTGYETAEEAFAEHAA